MHFIIFISFYTELKKVIYFIFYFNCVMKLILLLIFKKKLYTTFYVYRDTFYDIAFSMLVSCFLWYTLWLFTK